MTGAFFAKVAGSITGILVLSIVPQWHVAEEAVQSRTAATYYVDGENAAASDGNPGTEERPWRSLHKAADVLQPGDVVFVKEGTYEVEAGCTWSRPAINPRNSGTADSPIAFRAYPGHRVVVTNQVTDKGCAVLGARDRDYIIVDGFEVVVPSSKAVVVFRSRGTVIENMVIHGLRNEKSSNTDGIRIEDSNEILVRNNVIYDIHNEERTPNGTGIKLYYSYDVTIEHNEVYDVDSAIRNKAGGGRNVFRYNWVHDCTNYGIGLGTTNGRTTEGLEAHNNIVARCEVGIRVYGSPSAQNNNVRVWNNTVVNNSRLGISARDRGMSGVQVWNNIIFQGGNRDLKPENRALEFCDYNLYWFSTPGCGRNNVFGDPLFAGTSFDEPADFRPLDGSPAAGSGRNGENLGAYSEGGETIGMTSRTERGP
jgi:parallel beta-helix repeat protein